MSGLANEPQRVNCHACVHFRVTWEPARPYACRLMGFKTNVLPSLEVFRADGQECRGFVAKAQGVGNPNKSP